MKAGAEKAAEAIFARVLKEINPTKEELEESVYRINTVTSRLKKVVPKDVEIRVVGSVVRGTQLRGDSDVDIFLLFSKKYKRETITKDGLEYAKKILKGKGERYEIKYAQHPYVRIYIDPLELEADIVPAFGIDNIEDMGTAVDRSPMHAEFISSRLSEKQKDDVRTFKYLLKKNNIYGAEVMVSGFSGYLCELLVHHYGSLWKLLESVAGFKQPVLLGPKTREVLHDPALVKRFNSNFVVIDPVDPNRNVAAGVSEETLARFVLLARAFTKKPAMKFFEGRRMTSGKGAGLLNAFLKKSGLTMFAFETKVPDKSEDVVWPQLRKVAEHITNHCLKSGFSVYLTIPVLVKQRGLLVFFAPEERIRTRLQKGPSVFIRKAQEDFMKAHADSLGVMLSGDILYALQPNKYHNLEELMRSVAAGRVVSRHKDVVVRGSRLFVNKLPREYADAVYLELQNRITLA